MNPFILVYDLKLRAEKFQLGFLKAMTPYVKILRILFFFVDYIGIYVTQVELMVFHEK